MGARNKQVSRYISSSREFARPILRHIRGLVHKGCPEVEEVIKWGFPHFDYKGMMCSMAAFKEHCACGFWKASVLPDPHGLFKKNKSAMGNFGRICSLDDLPPDHVLLLYIKNAARLNDQGVRVPQKQKRAATAPLKTPAYLTAALKNNPKARETFRAFSPSNRRDYIDWLEEAKSEATRQRRLESALVWLNEGKPRNWKYLKSRSA